MWARRDTLTVIDITLGARTHYQRVAHLQSPMNLPILVGAPTALADGTHAEDCPGSKPFPGSAAFTKNASGVLKMPYPAWLGRYTSKRDQVAAVSRSSSEPSIHADRKSTR